MALSDLKTCIKCVKSKPLLEFNRASKYPTGRDRVCRECARERRSTPEYKAMLSRRKTRIIALHPEEFYKDVLQNGVRKMCSMCKRELPLKDFTRVKSLKSGFDSRCRKCNKHLRTKEKTKDIHLKRNYGITLEQYDALLKRQRGKCAICKNTCSSGRALAVDHCHQGGHVRGLLCTACNRALGLLKDDTTIVERALDYLLRI